MVGPAGLEPATSGLSVRSRNSRTNGPLTVHSKTTTRCPQIRPQLIPTRQPTPHCLRSPRRGTHSPSTLEQQSSASSILPPRSPRNDLHRRSPALAPWAPWCSEMSAVPAVRVLHRRESDTPRGTIRGVTILSCAPKGLAASGNRAGDVTRACPPLQAGRGGSMPPRRSNMPSRSLTTEDSQVVRTTNHQS